MRGNKSITLTLGKQQQVLDTLVASGEYQSASEAVRAAIGALQREKAASDDIVREKIREAVDDPRPSVPAAKVFSDLRAMHARQLDADERGA